MIRNMIQTYNEIYQIEKDYPFEVIVTANIFSERFKLCHTESDRASVMKKEKELTEKSSLLVFPDDQDRHFYLLLHEDLFDGSYAYCYAIAYEYSRAIDFCDCQEKFAIKNLRFNGFPEPVFFLFLSEIRAHYRGFSLLFNLTNVDQKAAISSYLCGLVPEYDQALSRDLPKQMADLASFYGEYLALSAYVNYELSLPDYLNRQPVHELLSLVKDNIETLSIFENFIAIRDTYNDFVSKKAKAPHVHTHKCKHAHGEHHIH